MPIVIVFGTTLEDGRRVQMEDTGRVAIISGSGNDTKAEFIENDAVTAICKELQRTYIEVDELNELLNDIYEKIHKKLEE